MLKIRIIFYVNRVSQHMEQNHQMKTMYQYQIETIKKTANKLFRRESK